MKIQKNKTDADIYKNLNKGFKQAIKGKGISSIQLIKKLKKANKSKKK